jgi:hypothetical protein
MRDVETCCGFGGSFTVKFGISISMADQNQSRQRSGSRLSYFHRPFLPHAFGRICKEQRHRIKTMHIADAGFWLVRMYPKYLHFLIFVYPAFYLQIFSMAYWLVKSEPSVYSYDH